MDSLSVAIEQASLSETALSGLYMAPCDVSGCATVRVQLHWDYVLEMTACSLHDQTRTCGGDKIHSLLVLPTVACRLGNLFSNIGLGGG